MPINVFDEQLKKIADPLADETRKIRKSLLIWCLISVALTVGGLFPTEVTILGLKVTSTNKTVLLSIVGAVILYFLVSFLIYGAADFSSWYFRQRSTEWEQDVANYDEFKKDLLAKNKMSIEERELMESQERSLGSIWRGTDAIKKYERIAATTPYLSVSRAILDFGLPIVCSFVAIYLLVTSGTL
jgi:hypothetical protein